MRTAIENLAGDQFEHFARELLRRELYRGLIPTSDSHDLGEDARTERTTAFLHNGLRVSVIASKTARWSKISGDCKRCRDTGRHIDVVVFVTSGNPRTTTQEKWRRQVRQEFRWDLDVLTMEWLAPVASAPANEDLVEDYLHLPPPGGDFVGEIERTFARETDHALRMIHPMIPGIPGPLPRDEVARIEEQLALEKAVLLTGDAGSGKSGIGRMLALSARETGRSVIYLDARRLVRASTEADLRQHLGLRGAVAAAVGRMGGWSGCLLVIDQLDNVIGLGVAHRLVELATDCCRAEGVDVVVICRSREPHEAQLLNAFPNDVFVELTSHSLSVTRSGEALVGIGIHHPSAELVELGRNLLNLELIAKIKMETPSFDFSTLADEVDLWEQHRQVLETEGEQIVADATALAYQGLRNQNRTVALSYPISQPHRRLISWGVIVLEGGRVYRFRHDKQQDYLYAWDATQRLAMPAEVHQDLDPHRARGILIWMDRIYSRQNTLLHNQFLRDVLNAR